MSSRSERVIEWAHLHGDDLAGVLRLDNDTDSETLAIIEDALWCAHDLEEMRTVLEALLTHAERIQEHVPKSENWYAVRDAARRIV